MVLKGVLILCTVSVLYTCNAYVLSGWRHRPFFSQYGNDQRLSSPTIEMQEEESKQYGGSVHKSYFVSQQKVSWAKARRQCKERGMILAVTLNLSEERHLEDYLRENSLIPKDEMSGFWIGSYRLSENDPWIWESNGQKIENYFGWIPGEPNHYEGEENCIEFKNDGHFLGWNNLDCDITRRYICENLPVTHESDKNVIRTDKKEALHKEVIKALYDKENENISTTPDDQITNDSNQYEFASPSEATPSNIGENGAHDSVQYISPHNSQYTDVPEETTTSILDALNYYNRDYYPHKRMAENGGHAKTEDDDDLYNEYYEGNYYNNDDY